MNQWEIVIGLEVHVQLQTKSKIFSGSSTAFGAAPNEQANAVDLALPGTLPVMNKEAVRMATLFGYAVNAQVNPVSQFARKNYFYPDLPKGYQTSQMALPIVGNGYLDIELDSGTKRIGITRAHLEEDAGKSLHEDFHGMTGIDLNRAGTPLLEIVSEPDLRSAKEAISYLKRLHSLVRTIGISDGNMQEGSFRCDANVSLRPMGQDAFGTRAEIKNVNSFRFIERAINFEVERQMDILESGGEVVQETRLYDAEADETRSMRSKEEAHDYRYFPCPDLPKMVLDETWLFEIKSSLPELPWQREERFINEYGLSVEDAQNITSERAIADYFEEIAKESDDAKSAANWINGEVASWLNREDKDFSEFSVHATSLATLIKRINDNTLSNKMAKQVFEELVKGNGDVDNIIETKGLKQISDTGALETMVDKVIANFPDQVEQYKNGNQKVLGFLVGQLMKESKGQANPKQLNELLRAKLGA